MASTPFSDSLKRVIAEARLIALALGYDHVSTAHLLLADCQLHPLSSLKGLLFKNHDDYEKNYRSWRVAEPSRASGSLPITKEAEKALHRAPRVGARYRDAAVYPCHLFVAASEAPASYVAQLLAAASLTPDDVKTHYIRLGQLAHRPPEQGVLDKLRHLARAWRG